MSISNAVISIDDLFGLFNLRLLFVAFHLLICNYFDPNRTS